MKARLYVLALLASAAALSAADWPQWRGPTRMNVSRETGLLKKWPADGPKLLWKVTGLGSGYGSPSTAGGKLYVMGTKGQPTGKDVPEMLHCVDLKDGKVAWSAEVGKTQQTRPNYPSPRSTPTVDGDRVYVISSDGTLACVSTDGKVAWKKSLKGDFGGQAGRWSYSESPLIDGDHLICSPGGSEATIVCLNKKDGSEVWRSAIGGQAGYSSPIISNAAGTRQYVTLLGSGTVGVDAKDGKLLWQYKRFAGNTANIPTVIPLRDQVFTVAGYGKGAALLTIASEGGKFTVKEEYYNSDLKNKHGGALIVGDLVFADYDDRGMPYCADWKTGTVKWTRKRGDSKGSGSASLTAADGHLYVRYANGHVALVPATADGYKEVSSFQQKDRSRSAAWAHPVISDGKLYLRDWDVLQCYDVKGE